MNLHYTGRLHTIITGYGARTGSLQSEVREFVLIYLSENYKWYVLARVYRNYLKTIAMTIFLFMIVGFFSLSLSILQQEQ